MFSCLSFHFNAGRVFTQQVRSDSIGKTLENNLSAITDKELEFSQGKETWERLLVKELKLDEVGQKSVKKHFDLDSWQTLSLTAPQEINLPSTGWKKASQTYIRPIANLSDSLTNDLTGGVRLFFFHKEFFSPKDLEQVFSHFSSFVDKQDIVCFLLGNQTLENFNHYGILVIDENNIAVGRSAHDQGANTIHELGLMGYCLTLKLEKGFQEYYQAIFVDSRFFNNIAKIRAAKLIAKKILEVSGQDKAIHLIALNSYRDWTLYERYSNMLRNNAQVASGLIAGADFVQTSGYQAVFDLEVGESTEEHQERALRMARNTSHILSLESMLGVVDDAAHGSFHLESLTQEYAQKGWEFMQELLKASSVKEKIQEVAQEARENREKNIHTRKHVLAGLNDFADPKEKLGLKSIKANMYRSTRSFEELRHKVEQMKNPPRVFIGVFGDYAFLNPRLNFAKNFFEVLGFEVKDSEVGIGEFEQFKKLISERDEEIIVYCAADTDYEQLKSLTHKPSTYLAGKVELDQCQNIYAGQDIYSALKLIVDKWS